MDDGKIQVRAQFALMADEALELLDGIGDGRRPIDDNAVRAMAKAIAFNARTSRQIVSWIVRLNSVGSFVVS